MKNDFDNEFAEQLRATDRPVSLDPESMVGQVVGARRKIARRQRRLLFGGAMVSCVVASLSVFLVQRDSGVEQRRLAKDVAPVAEGAQPIGQIDASVLAKSLKRIEALKQEIAAINQVRVEQQRALDRAQFSRTDISFESIANYKY